MEKSFKNYRIEITDIRPGFVDTGLVKGKSFWKTDVQTAAKQIAQAIGKRKKVAYITKRWILIAFIIKISPPFLLKKLFYAIF